MASEHFRVSTHLKDIIGRDLVTDQFVAVFELVKNGFDANASRVDIVLDLDSDRMWIVDDGKGMDADTIRDRWLFVAYSAKADGTEDADEPTNYRNRIRPRGQYAGNKGIGRFSCDTLGESLVLFSRTSRRAPTQQLTVQWEDFEADSRELFQTIGVELRSNANFPAKLPVPPPKASGTVLQINRLRGFWNYEEIQRLRQFLGKLIDPFGTTEDTPVYVTVVWKDLGEEYLDQLQGPVGNDIRDLLSEKTTRIKVLMENGDIRTELIDRGRPIYRVREKSGYKGLERASVHAEVFYLNQSAKNNFTRRMGVRPIEFGSIFLFLNGFRVFPIGEQRDDTFGLSRRKQQGMSRYLGTRDVMGRIDVTAPQRMFREASSRDAGLIEDAHVRDLYDAIVHKVIYRLERYVVGVTWKDKLDGFRDDASGLADQSTRQRVIDIIGQLALSDEIDLEYYDPEVIDVFAEDARSLDGAMKSLKAIAERQHDPQLLQRIEEIRARQAELERAEKEAVEAAEEAIEARVRAEERMARLERQATYLASTQDMTAEQMTLLLHQVMIYAGHIGAAVDQALEHAGEVSLAASEIEADEDSEDIGDAAAAIRIHNQKTTDHIEHIHLENDRLMAVARFASNARFELETDQLHGDVIAFLDEYVNDVRASRDSDCSVVFESNGISHHTRFPPVDLVVVVDNLLDNARKHDAKKMCMEVQAGEDSQDVHVVVTDDGRGLDEDRVDPYRIFDKGYTATPNGTGLGLYHARVVMREMQGDIQLDPLREPGRATFYITLPRSDA